MSDQKSLLQQRAAAFAKDYNKMSSGTLKLPNQFSKTATALRCEGQNAITNSKFQGVNFACEDQLSVAAHPGSIQAGVDAFKAFGTHSGGSPLFFGVNAFTRTFQEKFIEHYKKIDPKWTFNFFSTEFLARYGVIRAYANKHDRIVVDEHIAPAIMDGCVATMAKTFVYRHNDYAHMREMVQKARGESEETSVYLITQEFFPYTGVYTDVDRTIAISKESDAFLILDCSFTLFSSGEEGYGTLKKFAGYEDFTIIGAGSKVLGANVGFAVLPQDIMSEFFGYTAPSLTFSNAIPPSTASIATYNLKNILTGKEGESRRQALAQNVAELRALLQKRGYGVVGEAHSRVMVEVGSSALARAVVNLITEYGVLVSYVEHPLDSTRAARLVFNVQAHHLSQDFEVLVKALDSVLPAAQKYVEASREAVLAETNVVKFLAKL